MGGESCTYLRAYGPHAHYPGTGRLLSPEDSGCMYFVITTFYDLIRTMFWRLSSPLVAVVAKSDSWNR